MIRKQSIVICQLFLYVIVLEGSHQNRLFSKLPQNREVNKREASSSYPTFGHERPERRRPYKSPGDWATPAPDSNIDLGFTPVQTYIQVRKSNKVQHLPKSEAFKEASSPDEILNAHRLKEVLRTKKVQEVYSEEGYEDAAYDHGDEERHAEHLENYDDHKRGRYKVKKPYKHIEDVANAESKVVEKKDKIPLKKKKEEPSYKHRKVEKRTRTFTYTNERKFNATSPAKSTEEPKRGRQKYSGKSKIPPKFASQKADIWAFPSFFDEIKVKKPSSEKAVTSKQKQKTKNLTTSAIQIENPSAPAFGFIHSLTDAHYGGQVSTIRHSPKPISSHVINLTDGFKPIEAERHKGFEPKKVSKRVKREDNEDVHDTESEEYEKVLNAELNYLKDQILKNSISNLGPYRPRYSIMSKNSFRPTVLPFVSKEPLFDTKKYPYFYSKDIDPYSPLRYASNPDEFPKKSGNAMEFYDSRDAKYSCDPISINLDDMPRSNTTKHLEKQPGDKKRIEKLGEKIRCLKNRYFDKDPLDSPFFKEDEIAKMHPRSDNILQYHSSYQYQPNKSVEIYVTLPPTDSKTEATEERIKYQAVLPTPVPLNSSLDKPRSIPVREIEMTTPAPILGMRPPPTSWVQMPFSIIHLPQQPKPLKKRKKIQYKYNCLQPVSKMTVRTFSKRNDEIIYDCRDVTLIEMIREGNKHFQIIPKMRRSDLVNMLMDEAEDMRAGEVVELRKRRRRSAEDKNKRRKSSLFPNKSYLDKIIKRPPVINSNLNKSEADEKIRQEAVTTQKPTTTSTTTVAPKNTVSLSSPEGKKLESRPLTRLSGRDFLDRYHKAKRTKTLPDRNPANFWKLTNVDNFQPQKGSPKIKRNDFFAQNSHISRRNEPYVPPTLLYIVDGSTGRGHWVSEITNEYPRLIRRMSNNEDAFARDQKSKKIYVKIKSRKY